MSVFGYLTALFILTRLGIHLTWPLAIVSAICFVLTENAAAALRRRREGRRS